MGGDRIPYISYIKMLGGFGCGAYLLVSGTEMIYKDLNSIGTITVELFGSKLSATSLGIVVLFIGAVILISTIRWRVSESSTRVDTIEQPVEEQPSEISNDASQNGSSQLKSLLDKNDKKMKTSRKPPPKPPKTLKTTIRHEEYAHMSQQRQPPFKR